MYYGLILIIAAYLVALQLATRTNAGALLCSFVAVGIPYIINIIILWILTNASTLPSVANLFPVTGIVTFILQLVASFIVFKKVHNEEDISATIGWSIGGFILIIILIPFIVQKIM